MNKKKLNIGAMIFYLVLIVVLIASIISIFKSFNKTQSISYNEMIEHFMDNEVYGYKYNMNNDKMTIILKNEKGEENTKVC